MNKDFAKGMIVSLALKSLPVRKKSPIAYLYNGVRLPVLPEWDRGKYPYAFLTKQMLAGFGGIADYELRVVSKPTYTHASNGNYVVCYEGYYEYFEGEGWKELKQTSGSIHPDYIKWANFDITDENGAVVLEKSTPIPIYNEPVNYLYNGVKLPKLPEWDKTVYPYAMICEWSEGYRLFVGESAFTVYSDGTFFADVGVYTTYDKRIDTTEWVQGSHGAYFMSAVWADHDVLIHYTEDNAGELYMEASEPIPVYE